MKMIKIVSSLAIALSALTAHGSIVFSGDFQTGSGQIQITSPIELTITNSGMLKYLMLDEVLPAQGISQAVSLSSLSYAINGNAGSDLLGAQFNASLAGVGGATAKDAGFIFSGTGLSVSAGQTFRLEAQSWSGLFGGSQWPTFFNNLTFSGPYYASDQNGVILAAVPEPTTIGLSLAGLAGLLCSRFFRRRN